MFTFLKENDGSYLYFIYVRFTFQPLKHFSVSGLIQVFFVVKYNIEFTILTILSEQFGGMKYFHIVVHIHVLYYYNFAVVHLKFWNQWNGKFRD